MFLVIGLFGLTVGSFINAVVWRLHEQASHLRLAQGQRVTNQKKPDVRRKTEDSGLSIAGGRSMCPQCRHQLAVRDLIPVLSWVLLRGRCRYCQKPISIQYPLVELLTAGLFDLSYMLLSHSSLVGRINLVLWLYFLTVLVILAVYDLRWYILPDAVLLPACVVALVRLGWLVLAREPRSIIVGFLAAGLVAGGVFFVLAAVSKGRWMGGGDIKLAFLMGLLLGPVKTILAMMLAFNVAAVVGLILIGLKLKSRRDHIPFGPFLVGATVAAMLYGQPVINWYLQVVGIY